MNVNIECPLCQQAGRETDLTVDAQGPRAEFHTHCPHCGEVFGFLVAAVSPPTDSRRSGHTLASQLTM
jgi:hypothetical protein